jgi:DNA excision repair protein ERCC-1
MTYKSYEHKSAKMIQERIDDNYDAVLRSALTSLKGVNRTDVITLKNTFGVS